MNAQLVKSGIVDRKPVRLYRENGQNYYAEIGILDRESGDYDLYITGYLGHNERHAWKAAKNEAKSLY